MGEGAGGGGIGSAIYIILCDFSGVGRRFMGGGGGEGFTLL